MMITAVIAIAQGGLTLSTEHIMGGLVGLVLIVGLGGWLWIRKGDRDADRI